MSARCSTCGLPFSSTPQNGHICTGPVKQAAHSVGWTFKRTPVQKPKQNKTRKKKKTTTTLDGPLPKTNKERGRKGFTGGPGKRRQTLSPNTSGAAAQGERRCLARRSALALGPGNMESVHFNVWRGAPGFPKLNWRQKVPLNNRAKTNVPWSTFRRW